MYALRNAWHNLLVRPLSIKLGGKWSDGGIDAWKWVLAWRAFLSRYFNIGKPTFYGWEVCELCGIEAPEAEYMFERPGRERAVCMGGGCLDVPVNPVEDGED